MRGHATPKVDAENVQSTRGELEWDEGVREEGGKKASEVVEGFLGGFWGETPADVGCAIPIIGGARRGFSCRCVGATRGPSPLSQWAMALNRESPSHACCCHGIDSWFGMLVACGNPVVMSLRRAVPPPLLSFPAVQAEADSANRQVRTLFQVPRTLPQVGLNASTCTATDRTSSKSY